MSGRDGRIRTADLSLRRGPLYPSELRPHVPFIVPFQRFAANVAAEVRAVEVDGFYSLVGPPMALMVAQVF